MLKILATALAAGCAFPADRAAAADAPTFTRDVLPLLQSHCQACHRPGQVAPMSLIDYAEVRPWAKSIRTAVLGRVMPPFHANAPIGHFAEDPRLTDAEIDVIVRWIDSGAPQGDPRDAPPPREWKDGGWMIGEPDLVLNFPVYTTRADGRDDKVFLYSDRVFENETWVKAIEFKADNYRVVHHAGINGVDQGFLVPEDLILDADDKRVIRQGGGDGAANLMNHRNPLYTWLPGQLVKRTPEGSGLRIRAGDRIVADTHFAPTDEAIPVKISLGLKFVDDHLTRRAAFQAGRVDNIVVPPGEPDYRRVAWSEFPASVTIEGFSLHMHLRGESSRFIFHYPNGQSEVAFDVPRYNFDWQREYWLAKPFIVPSGTRVEFIAEWDNSAENPLNPDPGAEVIAGPRTIDEMYGGLVHFSTPLPAPVRVVDGIADPAAQTD